MNKKQAQAVEVPVVVEEKRKLFIGGNWKSNGTTKFVRDHIDTVLNKIKIDPKKADLIVAPMTIHVAVAKAMLNDIEVGVQNISMYATGAYSGEVSAE